MDMKKDLNLTGLIQETAQDIQRPLDQYVSDLDNAVKFDPPRQSHMPINLPSDTEESTEKLDQTSDIKPDSSEESKG
jgi:LPS O-antigen subunit length determinant protein (WzzB/FepE family)